MLELGKRHPQIFSRIAPLTFLNGIRRKNSLMEFVFNEVAV